MIPGEHRLKGGVLQPGAEEPGPPGPFGTWTGEHDQGPDEPEGGDDAPVLMRLSGRVGPPERRSGGRTSTLDGLRDLQGGLGGREVRGVDDIGLAM